MGGEQQPIWLDQLSKGYSLSFELAKTLHAQQPVFTGYPIDRFDLSVLNPDEVEQEDHPEGYDIVGRTYNSWFKELRGHLSTGATCEWVSLILRRQNTQDLTFKAFFANPVGTECVRNLARSRSEGRLGEDELLLLSDFFLGKKPLRAISLCWRRSSLAPVFGARAVGGHLQIEVQSSEPAPYGDGEAWVLAQAGESDEDGYDNAFGVLASYLPTRPEQATGPWLTACRKTLLRLVRIYLLHCRAPQSVTAFRVSWYLTPSFGDHFVAGAFAECLVQNDTSGEYHVRNSRLSYMQALAAGLVGPLKSQVLSRVAQLHRDKWHDDEAIQDALRFYVSPPQEKELSDGPGWQHEALQKPSSQQYQALKEWLAFDGEMLPESAKALLLTKYTGNPPVTNWDNSVRSRPLDGVFIEHVLRKLGIKHNAIAHNLDVCYFPVIPSLPVFLSLASVIRKMDGYPIVSININDDGECCITITTDPSTIHDEGSRERARTGLHARVQALLHDYSGSSAAHRESNSNQNHPLSRRVIDLMYARVGGMTEASNALEILSVMTQGRDSRVFELGDPIEYGINLVCANRESDD